MKKIIAMLLCIAMIAALGVSAFAEVPIAQKDTRKDYEIAADTAVENDQKAIQQKQAALNGLAAIKAANDAWTKDSAGKSGAALDAVYTQWSIKMAALKKAYGTGTTAGLSDAYFAAAADWSGDVKTITYQKEQLEEALKLDKQTQALAKAYGDAERKAEARAEELKKLDDAYAKIENPTVLDAVKLLSDKSKLNAGFALDDAKASATAAQKAIGDAQKEVKAAIGDVVAIAKVDAAAAVATAQAAAYNAAATEYKNAVSNFYTEAGAALNSALADLGYSAYIVK